MHVLQESVYNSELNDIFKYRRLCNPENKGVLNSCNSLYCKNNFLNVVSPLQQLNDSFLIWLWLMFRFWRLLRSLNDIWLHISVRLLWESCNIFSIVILRNISGAIWRLWPWKWIANTCAPMFGNVVIVVLWQTTANAKHVHPGGHGFLPHNISSSPCGQYMMLSHTSEISTQKLVSWHLTIPLQMYWEHPISSSPWRQSMLLSQTCLCGQQ